MSDIKKIHMNIRRKWLFEILIFRSWELHPKLVLCCTINIKYFESSTQKIIRYGINIYNVGKHVKFIDILVIVNSKLLKISKRTTWSIYIFFLSKKKKIIEKNFH